ncbi:predicted protein [Nematostella vectensis]|uniref:ALOG domain-containing protein n=1 Tax=Nematostella vectensis TaxID=45351 RepID=A7SJ15_NEMVE|nr:predicted protein [Nematostella vectensis]|eukprot:XP_001628382.1 predicted protein [Nematostella vectensis]
MHSELHKDIGRTHTSGVKYLEYEKDRGTGDWRMLADLLPESVRYFKEPVKQELLPRPQLDSEYPLPNVNLSFNPRPGTMYGRKRKGTMDLEEYEITSGNRMGHPGREETMHQHPAWVQNQVDGGKLVMTAMSAPPGTPVSSIPSASVSPMVTTPISKVASMQLPPSEVHVRAQSKSPINNSVMRGSHFEVAGASRDEGRGNNLVSAGHMSPHSRSPRPPSGPLSKSAETQSGLPNDGDGKEKEKGSSGQSILRYYQESRNCLHLLSPTEYVVYSNDKQFRFCQQCGYARQQSSVTPFSSRMRLKLDEQKIDERLEYLSTKRNSSRYAKQKPSLERDLTQFLDSVTPHKSLATALPADIVAFLVWKYGGGRTRVHRQGCQSILQTEEVWPSVIAPNVLLGVRWPRIDRINTRQLFTRN